MTFALTAVKIEEAMKESGCLVCRMARQTAARAVDSFLWEHVNDAEVRQNIIEAYGFCPEHTLRLVASEMANSGLVLGVNIIYEQLGRVVSRDLRNVMPAKKLSGNLQKRLPRLGILLRQRRGTVLPPKRRCPVCELVEQANSNVLAALFTELEDPQNSLRNAYQQSDGLCLVHLRSGLEEFAGEHPEAGRFLIQDTVERLEKQSQRMREYIRKSNWEYRDEILTVKESNAWRQTLTFFTGYPESKFTFHVKDE